MVCDGGRRTLCPIQSDTKIDYAASRLQGADQRAPYIMWADLSCMYYSNNNWAHSNVLRYSKKSTFESRP